MVPARSGYGAVGDYVAPNSVHATLVAHWDGAEWSIVPSPSPSQLGSSLYSVTGLSAAPVEPSYRWASHH